MDHEARLIRLLTLVLVALIVLVFILLVPTFNSTWKYNSNQQGKPITPPAASTQAPVADTWWPLPGGRFAPKSSLVPPPPPQ